MIDGLKVISLDDLDLFKDAFAEGKRKGSIHYFPFLYFYSLGKNRDLLYCLDSGSICTFLHKKNLEDPTGGRLAIYFPPAPMNVTALKNSIELISDYNRDKFTRIVWLDEQEAVELASVPGLEYELNYKYEEYMYNPDLYRDMAGKKFARIRNQNNKIFKTPHLEILPYDTKYADQCLNLLKDWEATQGTKYEFFDDRGYTRSCLKFVDLFPEQDLFGKVITIDDQVKSFGFAGQMHSDLATWFIAKSDHSVTGLNNFMLCDLFRSLQSFSLINGSSDLGYPGLKFAKESLQPVDKLKIYNATKVNSVKIPVSKSKTVVSLIKDIGGHVFDESLREKFKLPPLLSEGLFQARQLRAGSLTIPADTRTDILKGLKVLSIEDQEIICRCLSASEHKAWISFFPFLISFSERNRWKLYWEKYRGSVCLYCMRESSSGQRLSLYLPPFPFRKTTLIYAIKKIDQFNQNENGKITWVEESMREEIARMGYDVIKVGDEYIYSKESLATFFNNQAIADNIIIRKYAKDDEQECLDLLKRWRADCIEKGVTTTGYYYKRSCIQNAHQYIEGTIIGEVLLVDGTIQGVCFAGVVNPKYAICFVTIASPEYSEMKLLQQASMAGNFSTPFFNNYAEKVEASAPYLSDHIQPVEIHGLYSARKHASTDGRKLELETKNINTSIYILAARKLGLQVDVMSFYYSYCVISKNDKKLFVYFNATSETNVASRRMTNNKYFSQRILREGGVPVPESKIFHRNDEEKIIGYVRRFSPVVIKPIKGSNSVGVTINPQTDEEIRAAIRLVNSGKVMVERFIPGGDYRILIYRGRVLEVLMWVPPYVIGNGLDTLHVLVGEKNRFYWDNALDSIVVDCNHLSQQGLDMAYVPNSGQKVFVHHLSESPIGGEPVKVDLRNIHPENIKMFVKAAELSGLVLAGLDFRSEDLSVPYNENAACVNEINSTPHVWPHYFCEQKKDLSAVMEILEEYFSGS